ncbi:MAC/perforin domain-containing protein [Croceitalea dokdonensis]|nr:MAC/perforin domain-containing protein [Croceitalea dokdonensis]
MRISKCSMLGVLLSLTIVLVNAQEKFDLLAQDNPVITGAAFVPSMGKAVLFANSQLTFYPLGEQSKQLEWLTLSGLEHITAVLGTGQDEIFVFDGGFYIRVQPSTGTLLSEWTQWVGLPNQWRNKITAIANWDDTSILLFNGTAYVRYDFVQQDYIDTGDISLWPNWPQNWDNGATASLNIDDGFIYFFNEGQVVPYNFEEQRFFDVQSLTTAFGESGSHVAREKVNPNPVVRMEGCISGTTNDALTLQKTPLYGSNQSTSIEDRFPEGLEFKEVKIFTSKIWGKTVVCGLQTIFKDATGAAQPAKVFGKTSSTVHSVKLQGDECIVGISGDVGGDTGNYLNNVQIITSSKSSERVGNKFARNAQQFSITLPDGAKFNGFYGTFSTNISAIGIKYFGSEPEKVVSRPVRSANSPSSDQARTKQYVANSGGVTAEQAMQLGMGMPPNMIDGLDDGQDDATVVNDDGYEIVDAYIDDYDDFTSELGNMAEFMVQPLSGIDWLGAGFDILYFDPLNPNDLKPRKSFRTVLVTNSPARAGNKNQYLKPFGSEFYSANAGSVADSTSWVTSYQQFTNSFNISMSPSVSVPGVASGSFSPSYSQMNSTSIGSESIYMFNKIKRKLHEVELKLTWVDNVTGQKYKQKLDRSFKQQVAELPVPTGPVKNLEITQRNQRLPNELSVLQGKYYGLINKYGTHFAKKVAYGGQYISRTQVKRSQYEKTRMTEAGFKAEAEATIKGVTVGNKVDFGFKDGSTTQKGNQAFRRDVFVQGGNGEDDLDKWRNKVDENLAPIEIYFAPMSEILVPNMFADDPDIGKKSEVLAIMIDKYITDKYKEGQTSKNDFFRALPDLPVPGNVMIKNNGGYVMWFTVRYEYQGEWETKESDNFTLGFTEDIEIPVGAKNITITASQTTGEIFTETLEKPEIVCYKCGGTIFKTNYSKCDE